MDSSTFEKKQREIDDMVMQRVKELNAGEPVFDGIFDAHKYANAGYKILFISKEPNNTVSKDYKKLKTQQNNEFWIPIKYITYGIFNKKYDWKEFPAPQNKDVENILFSTAFINVIKFPSASFAERETLGTSPSTAPEAMTEVYGKFRDILEKQIEVINPDIIICLGTFTVMQESLINGSYAVKQKGYRNRYSTKDRLILDCYFSRHAKPDDFPLPAAGDFSKGIPYTDYYADIFNAFKEWETGR